MSPSLPRLIFLFPKPLIRSIGWIIKSQSADIDNLLDKLAKSLKTLQEAIQDSSAATTEQGEATSDRQSP